MPGLNYDPAKTAGSENYEPYAAGLEDVPPAPIGPGGATVNVENNEKGILEEGMASIISRHQQAALGSSHDAERRGIYMTNSVGDND
jgi:hypothetical protein